MALTMTRSSSLSDALDLHVAGIATMPLLIAACLPFAWLPWLVTVLPLGRLAMRAQDLRRSGRSPVPHLLVNGAVIGVLTALAFLLSPAD